MKPRTTITNHFTPYCVELLVKIWFRAYNVYECNVYDHDSIKEVERNKAMVTQMVTGIYRNKCREQEMKHKKKSITTKPWDIQSLSFLILASLKQMKLYKVKITAIYCWAYNIQKIICTTIILQNKGRGWSFVREKLLYLTGIKLACLKSISIS